MKNNKSYRFLFIEDQVSDVELLVYRLKQAEFKFTYDRLVDKIAVTKYLQTKKVDLDFTDYNLPSCTGEEILKAVKNFSLMFRHILRCCTQTALLLLLHRNTPVLMTEY